MLFFAKRKAKNMARREGRNRRINRPISLGKGKLSNGRSAGKLISLSGAFHRRMNHVQK
jgi:hypothetical protein